MNILRNLFAARVFRYLFAGGCTTLINFAAYTTLTRVMGMDETLSNIIAVMLSVIFAYFINKLFVFRSKAESYQELAREFVAFVSGRGMTIGLDIGGLYVLHTLLGLNDLAVKVALNVLVIVLNYVISRYFVFKKQSNI